MQGFGKIDCIKHLNLIWCPLVDYLTGFVLYNLSILTHLRYFIAFVVKIPCTFCKHSANFFKHCSLWICHNIRALHLHKRWFYKSSRFSRSRTSNNQDIFISIILGMLWSCHSEPFCCRKRNIIPLNRIRIWFKVFFGSPFSRTILLPMSELFCVLLSCVHNYLKYYSCSNSKEKGHRFKRGHKIRGNLKN